MAKNYRRTIPIKSFRLTSNVNSGPVRVSNYFLKNDSTVVQPKKVIWSNRTKPFNLPSKRKGIGRPAGSKNKPSTCHYIERAE